MMTDPIADMLTRIRNAYRINREKVDMPASVMKAGIAEVLKREGYITDFARYDDGRQGVLRVYLKYGPRDEKVFNSLQRVSKPGRRVYARVGEIPRVRNGLGIAILTTPQGVLSDRECRKRRVGGEVLCTVW
jgi:small subunit ribosomal protein S8